jgi:hypothetical protein
MEAMTGGPWHDDISRHLDELLGDDQHMTMPPKPPDADNILRQVQEFITRWPAPVPALSRLEVGSFVRFRYVLAQQLGMTRRDMAAPGPAPLYGIPIVETDRLGPDEWRLLGDDGQVIKEGTL